MLLTNVVVASQVRSSCEGSIAARTVVSTVCGVSPEAVDASVSVCRVHCSREDEGGKTPLLPTAQLFEGPETSPLHHRSCCNLRTFRGVESE